MTQIPTGSALPGQTLAKAVVSKSGMVILGAGTRLTEHYIARLKKLGVPDISIRREAPPSPSPSPPAPEVPSRPRDGGGDGFKTSLAAVKEAVEEFKDSEAIRKRLSVPMLGQRFFRIYGQLLDLIGRQPVIMEQLAALHRKDPFLFRHAMNVSAYSAIVGFANGYGESQLYELTLSALLSDIGMTGVPTALYAKSDTLSRDEKERIEAHTLEGYQQLVRLEGIPHTAAVCALQHHERYDGSGYPFGIRKEEIHPYAQIIGIADIYDALVSPRYHRKAYTPGEAIEYLLGSGDTLFNLPYVKLFVSHVSIYPVGTRVQLNSGQTAVITSVDPSFVQRPIVRIIQEPDGSIVLYPYELDLKDRLEVVISDIVQ
ncbi:HD-GYP domain-containing protein [Cohnella fermenti]|uniref:HD-GYP domain-containing protein n=1 Tax=Cohnella fermenti TaxID=2565925 RepID=A0A4S4BYE9_9BACL|nr:HD-GYP domain-containing protein [Cohnella fermenti]THF80286.1 HD-GYP domain-containing protein [Cohnella fermenti]